MRYIEERLRGQALIVEEMIRGQPASAYSSILKRITDSQTEPATRITLIGIDGQVLAETSGDGLEHMEENHGFRPEVAEASASADRFGKSLRNSATEKQKMIYMALRTEGVDGVSYVRLALPLTKIHDEISVLSRLIWITAGVTAGLSLLFAFWLVCGFLRPLHELSQGADKIA